MKYRELIAPGRDAAAGEEVLAEDVAPQIDPWPARARRQLDQLPSDHPNRHLAPLGLVALAVAFNLWILRAEILPVLYVNDGGMHLSMVRLALERMQDGHLPFDAWYPYLGLGSSWFHHYQSLPHIVTATLGAVIGPERAYSGSLYVLLATWPISVYFGARLLGWGRWIAGAAAAVSPLLVSAGDGAFANELHSYGYELHSYLFRGPGLWTQLWAMWLLPIAWGLTWRTVSGRTPARYASTALVVGLTAAFHFLTAYLTLLALGVWVLIRPSEFRQRLGRAALLGVGALLIISWVVVPALQDAEWVSQSAFWHGEQSNFFDSYGAPKVLTWLLTGQILDAGRIPVITAFMLIGVAVCAARFRRDERVRALLGVMGLSLILYSGRPTFGPLIGLLPGSDGLFLHRYVIGVQLAGTLLAGVGLAWAAKGLAAAVRRRTPNAAPALATTAVVVFLCSLLAPAWAERAAHAHLGGTWLREQRAFTAVEGPPFQALIEEAERNGPGRIYSGLLTNWGRRTRLGHVPLYLALLGYDADAIGFLFHTTSLSSDFEYEFDDSDPEHYELLGVRYLILPSGREPPVDAGRLDEREGYVLWEIEGNGYLDVVDTVGPPIRADQVTLHDQTESFLTSDLLRDDRYPTIAFAGRPAAEPTLVKGSPAQGPAGVVRTESVDISAGEFIAEVVAERDAVVLLRSTFDPAWQVKVDGRVVEPQMVAPSFVGAAVPPGRHTVAFRYRPFPRYDLLFAIGVVTVFGLWAFSAFVVNPRARRRDAAAR